MEILSYNFLLERLKHPNPQVRMWATYHLAEHWQSQAKEFVPQLIESDIENVRESGVYLIGKLKLKEFSFPLFRIFNSSQGTLRRAAAIALGEMQYSNVEGPLWVWLDDLLTSREIKIYELRGAAQALLLNDADAAWWQLEKKLPSHYSNHIISLALYGLLCDTALTGDRLSFIVKHYAVYRRHFTDPQFLNHFLTLFENQEIVEFVRIRTSYSYSFKLIYLESFNILGLDISREGVELMEQIDVCSSRQQIDHLVNLLLKLLLYFKADETLSLEMVFLKNFVEVIKDWDGTIIKIQEQEFYFLISLPLTYCIREVEKECLHEPVRQYARLTRIYHSQLLRYRFMNQVLTMLCEGEIQPLSAIYPTSQSSDSLKDALWKICTGQNVGDDYPLPTLLPRPWKLEIPLVMSLLTDFYKNRFVHFVHTSQHDQLDYALEVFKRMADEDIVIQLLQHFPLLINRHFHHFFEFIEQIPDLRFLESLLRHWRSGERELSQLIFLLCEIHHLENPLPYLAPSKDSGSNEIHARILCPQCHTCYQYEISVVYFDKELLDQRRPFSSKDLWTADELFCKNCNALLPFETDDNFRSNLYAEMLTAHLLKLSEEEETKLHLFKPIQFPRYYGKKTNPSVFLKRVEGDLKSNRVSKGDLALLSLELGKLYLAMERFAQAREAFMRSLDSTTQQPIALFHLGVIAFREKNLYDARLHFSRLKEISSAADFALEEENLYDLTLHYLEILDRRDFKRSTFKLVAPE